MSMLEYYLRREKHLFNSKEYFKYIIPKSVYDLFEFASINHFEIEFFTLNMDYKEIWSYFRQADRVGRCELNSIGWEENSHCYVVDIFAGDFLMHYCKEFYSPFNYMGKEVYIKNAYCLGYYNLKEINEDFKKYHNRIGGEFKKLGLLWC